MTRPPPRPPRFTATLLEAVLPPAEAEPILGDLEEAFHALAASRGVRTARRWYRGQALRYLLRLSPTRARAVMGDILGNDMTRDLRFALRRLIARPGLTVVVLATLALGIGANVTVFSVVDSILLRALPIEDPESVVQIYGSSDRDGNAGGMFQGFLPVSYPNFEDVRDAATSVDGIFVHSMWPVSVSFGEEAERVEGLYVSASYFDVLGVQPALGRTFRPEEDRQPGADAVVVLRHGYWMRQFGGDPGIVGRTITVNARSLEVIGVAPPGFRGTNSTLQPDLFVPVSMIGDVPPWGPMWDQRGLRFFNMGARIAAGRTMADVAGEFDALATRLAETYPETNRNRGLQVLPQSAASVDPNQGTLFGRTGAVLLIMASLVLLIACMNVANLLLTQALSRTGELAVRTSLGATKTRLMRELAMESGLLFVGGAGLGTLAAGSILGLLDGTRPPAFQGGALEVGLDPRVLVFTGVVTFVCMAAFGLIPSIRAASQPAAQALRTRRSGSSSSRSVREVLVLGQIALSVVSLAAAGAFLRSVRAAQAIDPGFAIEGVGMLDVDLAAQGLDAEERRVFYGRMIETAASLPDVTMAAVGGERPLAPAPLRRVTRVDEDREDPGTGHYVRFEPVSSDFFEALGVAIQRGRAVEIGDRLDTRLVGVANARLSELLWEDRDPLGQRVVASLVDDPIEVVGVAGNAKAVSLSEEPQPILYVPLEQHQPPTGTLFVRLGDAGNLETVRRAVQELDPTLPLFGVNTVEEVVAEDLWTNRMTARVLGMFGLAGLLLAGVGIYGVVAFTVRERTREMGLRLALGAGQRQVLVSAVARVLVISGAGALLGIAAATMTLGAFDGILVGVNGSNPLPHVAVAAGLLLVALCAAYLPARRATSVDPMVVLRSE